ncbi:hypothetical protein DEV91_1576 [Phyllobacterium brassicacearum]|nr:hypothetical protein DEV91_1576 [Phyllobacterium brassicacearum]
MKSNTSKNAGNQQPADVGLPGLRHPAKPFLATGRELPWHKSEPGRESTAAPEVLHGGCEGLDGHQNSRKIHAFREWILEEVKRDMARAVV